MAETFVSAEVDTSQFKALEKQLEARPKEQAKRIVRDALEVGGNEFKRALVAEAPSRTGFLASHFNIRFSFRGNNGTGGTAFVGPNGRMDYPLASGGYRKKGSRKIGRVSVLSVARWLEFGTSKMSANPFMSRAFEIAKSVAMDRVIPAIKQGLRV